MLWLFVIIISLLGSSNFLTENSLTDSLGDPFGLFEFHEEILSELSIA